MISHCVLRVKKVIIEFFEDVIQPKLSPAASLKLNAERDRERQAMRNHMDNKEHVDNVGWESTSASVLPSESTESGPGSIRTAQEVYHEDSYIFDIYYGNKDRVWLIDIAPAGLNSHSNPLLFTWKELGFSLSSETKDVKEKEVEDEVEWPLFKVVPNEWKETIKAAVSSL